MVVRGDYPTIEEKLEEDERLLKETKGKTKEQVPKLSFQNRLCQNHHNRNILHLSKIQKQPDPICRYLLL